MALMRIGCHGKLKYLFRLLKFIHRELLTAHHLGRDFGLTHGPREVTMDEVPKNEEAESIPSTTGRSNRRRRLLIDRPFQYRLIGLLLAVWVANSLFFSIVLYYFFEGHIKRFYVLVPRPGMVPWLSSTNLFLVAIGFVVLFGITMVAILGLYLSNQIAGPLYRVKMSLNRVSRGDVNFEVRFRDRDFLEDLPGYFNGMLKALKDQGTEEIEILKSVESNLDDLAKVQTLLRELREKKEIQLGLIVDEQEGESGTAPAVH